MISLGVLEALAQAALCFTIIWLIRFAVVYLGSRVGGLLTGTPMLIFPLLAMQAWLGPPVTRTEVSGSIVSITAVSVALWPLWLPIDYGAFAAMLIAAVTWLAVVAAAYATGLPVAVMAVALAANCLFILVFNRGHQPSASPSRTKLTKAAIPTAVFLIVFFTTKELVPDFIRGVLAMFPIVMLATIYFVRSATTRQGFHSFVVYSHCAIGSTAMFVVSVYYALLYVSIVPALAISLLVSIGISVTIGQFWRVGGNAAAAAGPK